MNFEPLLHCIFYFVISSATVETWLSIALNELVSERKADTSEIGNGSELMMILGSQSLFRGLSAEP